MKTTTFYLQGDEYYHARLDGLCEILIDPEEYEEENFIQPDYVDEKVAIRGLSPDEDDDELE